MTLYVIDDHPLMREAVVMLTRRIRPGANVVELDRLGGIEAAVKQHGAPDLITLDLKLPDTTGASGVHELKKRFPETPLAVLSASPAADAEEQCIEAGADIYIEKSSGARSSASRKGCHTSTACPRSSPWNTIETFSTWPGRKRICSPQCGFISDPA